MLWYNSIQLMFMMFLTLDKTGRYGPSCMTFGLISYNMRSKALCTLPSIELKIFSYLSASASIKAVKQLSI